jgi:amino acid transporter
MRLTRDPRKAYAVRVRGAAPSTPTTTTHGETPPPEANSPARASPPRRLGLPALVCLIFFTVSGGAFGLEPLVAAVGPGWAVVLVLVTPLLWGLPIALMVAELSAALPEEGGYYVWVREALGDFWGVQEGWWTVCYTAVDMAIYPVLFVNYLAYFIPSLATDGDGSASGPVFAARWIIATAMIGAALTLNWRGARAVGSHATLTIGLVLLPFAWLVVLGLGREGAAARALAAVREGLGSGCDAGALATGLSVVLWNYCGWDNVSTYAGEVRDPRRAYPRALALALPLITAAYLLPMLAGIAATTDPATWDESAGWPSLARVIGGPSLGTIVAGAALVSAWSLFNGQVLYASRLPYAMARDGWLPLALARTSQRTGVPTVALVATCLVSALCTALPFGKLVVLDILLYSAGLALEFAALIVLRIRRPDLARPSRVPGGSLGLAWATLAPLIFAAVVAGAAWRGEGAVRLQLLIATLAITGGLLLYYSRRRGRRDRPEQDSESPG